MNMARTDLYFGIFEWQSSNGIARVTRRNPSPPAAIPDPRTGHGLHISTAQAQAGTATAPGTISGRRCS